MTAVQKKASREPEPSKPVEVWSVTLTALLLVGGLLKFFFFDWRNFELEQRQKLVAVEKAESEIVTLEGNWQSPEVQTLVGGKQTFVSPIFFFIRNGGEKPVHIKNVELRVFTSTIGDVSVMNSFSLERMKKALAVADNAVTAAGDVSQLFGFIDPDSENWNEQAYLEIQQFPRLLPPGQELTDRRHVLSADDSRGVLTKVEIRVTTDKSSYRWYGFSPTSPVRCYSVDSIPAEVSSNPAPPSAPQ
jgi:hypothetical protein